MFIKGGENQAPALSDTLAPTALFFSLLYVMHASLFYFMNISNGLVTPQNVIIFQRKL